MKNSFILFFRLYKYIRINNLNKVDNKEAENGWFEVGCGFYEKSLNGQPSYGSLFKGCMTPDGKMVDVDGKLIK